MIPASRLEAVEQPLVLLVDDEVPLLNVTKRLLERQGIPTIACSDGETALQALATHSFDAIISDIAMPHMDGIEFLRAVRSQDLDLPVLFITGSPTVETAIQAVELGAFRYLTKPFDADDLTRTTWRAIRLYRLAKAKEKAFEDLGGTKGIGSNPAGLQTAFDRALKTLRPVYQPIIHMKERKIFGYEALARTEDPRMRHPEALLDAAERLGQLPRIFRSMQEMAADAFRKAQLDCYLFLNLHPTDILDPTLLDTTNTLYQIASHVVLEVTERATLDRVANVRERIAALRKTGYRIAIDDLGAGYAGLTSFASLEPEFVKFDMSLVRNVHESNVKQNLIRSMASLCHDLGMLTVAEGIETEAELNTVLELGCDLLQGYYLGRPSRDFATTFNGA